MPDNLSLKSKVPGLDRLLMGGFKLPPAAEGKEQLGLILLIRGKPGTGKTTLALQITNAFLEWERSQNMKMDTMYFSLDQAQKDIESKLEYIRKKTVPLKNDSPKIKSYIDNDYYGSDPEKPIGYAAYSIEAALSVLHDLEKIDSTKGWCRNLTVVDGLNCLGKMDRQEIFELSTLIHLLRKTSRMSILVYEPMEHEEISVEYLVDMTIDLKGEIETAGHIDYFFHSLSITKSRYQATGLGWHKFKIKDNGIEVYPSIHFHVHQKGYLTDQFTKSQNPMSDRQQEEGKPVAISGYNDSSDFSIDEFRNQKKDPHKLFCSIEKASYSLEIKKLKSNKKIVDWLNKILKNPKLYDVIQEKTNLYLTDDMKRLKEKIDSIPYSSSKKIKDDDLRAINKFNRLIIERAHPLETPGIEFCNEAIITRILHSIRRGSSTVLFGPRRTSKSQLTMDFLRAGSQKGKYCLLLSLMDNQDTILQEAVCQRRSCDKFVKKGKSCRECFKKVFLFFLRPGCISPEEFFHSLKKRLDDAKEKGENIRRLVFWDLTQLEYRFPLLSGDPMFLPALMDFLKQYTDEKTKKVGITSLFMSAANTKLSSAASAMADNVIFCWRDNAKEKIPEDFINSVFTKLKSEETDKLKEELKKTKDYLVIYVDRAEGVIETKKRNIFCFPIVDETNPLYTKIPLQDFFLEVEPFRIDKFDWLKMASEELERIDRLQGVPR